MWFVISPNTAQAVCNVWTCWEFKNRFPVLRLELKCILVWLDHVFYSSFSWLNMYTCMCVLCLPTAIPQPPLHVSWVMTGGPCIVFPFCFFSKIDKSIRGCSESRDQNRKFSVLETILPQTRCSGFEIIPHTLHVLMPSTRVNLLQQLNRVYHWDWTWSLALRTVTAGTRGAPPPNTCSLYRIENKSCVMEMSPSFSVWLIQCAATKEEDGRGQKEKLGWMEQSGGLKPV